MAKIGVFNSVSLDGYFCDANGDMSWAHSVPQDAEWREFVGGNASGGGPLLFGRVTHDMMAAFWPSPAAARQMPDVAAGMNRVPKYVCSRSLKASAWQNTTVLNGDLVSDVRRLKQQAGDDLTILGSGTLVAQLTEAGLIDSIQLVVVPVVLGSGRTMFDGVTSRPAWKPVKTRTFGNGNVVLWYER